MFRNIFFKREKRSNNLNELLKDYKKKNKIILLERNFQESIEENKILGLQIDQFGKIYQNGKPVYAHNALKIGGETSFGILKPKVTYKGTVKEFQGKKYVLNNTHIYFEVPEGYTQATFIVAAFGSVDEYPQDYMRINTPKGNLDFDLRSKSYKAVISNVKGITGDIKQIKTYNTVISGQRYNNSYIYEITISNLVPGKYNIYVYCNQSFSDEAMGYQLDSLELK